MNYIFFDMNNHFFPFMLTIVYIYIMFFMNLDTIYHFLIFLLVYF